jgi:hypothetical protein
MVDLRARRNWFWRSTSVRFASNLKIDPLGAIFREVNSRRGLKSSTMSILAAAQLNRFNYHRHSVTPLPDMSQIKVVEAGACSIPVDLNNQAPNWITVYERAGTSNLVLLPETDGLGKFCGATFWGDWKLFTALRSSPVRTEADLTLVGA